MFVLLGSLSHCVHIITSLAQGRTSGIVGAGVVGRAVQWGVVALRMPGPSETAHLQIPSYALTGGLSE